MYPVYVLKKDSYESCESQNHIAQFPECITFLPIYNVDQHMRLNTWRIQFNYVARIIILQVDGLDKSCLSGSEIDGRPQNVWLNAV